MITTVKPSAVDVGVPNVGVNAAAREVALTVFEPLVYPVRAAWIVTAAVAPGFMPITVSTAVLVLNVA